MTSLTMAAPSSLRRRRTFSIAAVVGVALALAWFVGLRLFLGAQAEAARAAQVEGGTRLVTLLRATAQDRVRTGAQVLAQDTRLQAAAGLAALDPATAKDLLQDLQRLDPQEIFALLSADGRVIATRGAPRLEGLDLSSSAVVKTALSQTTAATGVWMVDDRAVEIAMAAIRVGERRVGLLAVGVRVEDAALATAAAAARVHLALFVEGKPAWTSEQVPERTWRVEPTGAVEVTDTARYVIAPRERPGQALELFAWAVPLAALVFAAIAFWRGGAT